MYINDNILTDGKLIVIMGNSVQYVSGSKEELNQANLTAVAVLLKHLQLTSLIKSNTYIDL